MNAYNKVTLSNLFEQMEHENLKQLNIIVKADVQGTAEALKQSLEKLSDSEVAVKVIHSNAGAINESDVNLAKAAKAIIIGFNVRPNATAKEVAKRMNRNVRHVYSRPLKSTFLRDIVLIQYLANFLNQATKSFHGSFEVICSSR